MSSPIHKYLFSPPPSPPRRPLDANNTPTITIERAGKLTTLKTLLLPTDLIPRAPLGGSSSELKPRSPRTPQNGSFTLNDSFPSSYTYPSRTSPTHRIPTDIEATPRAVQSPRTPRVRSKSEKQPSSPPCLPTNVPSSPIAVPSSLPKPLLRLMLLASLLLSSIMLLIFVPSARLPSLSAASISRRLALAPDGRAYLDVERPVRGFAEGLERDYVPAVVKSSKMMKRAAFVQTQERTSAPHPMSTRPAPSPLPQSHEFLALQAYLLQSHAILPESVDPSSPLDANDILGFATHHHDNAAMLREIEAERAGEVVVWYGLDGAASHPHDLLSYLSELHTSQRKPTLLPCLGRPDLPHIQSILDRLGYSRSHPLVVLGNKVIPATPEVLKNGKLAVLIDAIGWGKSETEAQVEKGKEGWKPKFAVVKKVEEGEEEAMAKMEKKGKKGAK